MLRSNMKIYEELEGTTAAGFLQNTDALTIIFVPMQSVQAYKTAGGWSDYASIIQGY